MEGRGEQTEAGEHRGQEEQWGAMGRWAVMWKAKGMQRLTGFQWSVWNIRSLPRKAVGVGGEEEAAAVHVPSAEAITTGEGDEGWGNKPGRR